MNVTTTRTMMKVATAHDIKLIKNIRLKTMIIEGSSIHLEALDL